MKNHLKAVVGINNMIQEEDGIATGSPESVEGTFLVK